MTQQLTPSRRSFTG